MDNMMACEMNSRANICDTAKGNRIMLTELRSLLNSLANTLECIHVPPASDAVNAEPDCLLDEVLLHKEILEDMQCIVKRMYTSLKG